MRANAALMVARFAVASFGACALLLGAACGGSSSETPPPLQPDPKGFHYAGVKVPRPAEEASDAPEKEEDEPEESEAPAKGRSRKGQAPSTWGQSDSSPAPRDGTKRPELK